MNFEIATVLIILIIALILFISEALRMDLVALLVLCALTVAGVVTPNEAISGFSNAAVITVWAMFILSEGLTRTGIADILGRQVMRVAGRKEIPLIFWIMVISGGLSAFMNNIGVAALMLPVVIDIARRTEIPPSRLLMPLAYGCLLGGLTTLIGTPPNLLIAGALAQGGEIPFTLFDFTPVGTGAMLTGVVFVCLIGRLMLPKVDPAGASAKRSQRTLRSQYSLQERTFATTVPYDSVLVGKTLAESRISSAAGLIVMMIERRNQVIALPSRQTILESGDQLMIQGRLDRFNEMRQWSDLIIEREAPLLQTLLSGQVQLVEATIAKNSSLVKDLLHHTEFRRRFGANVLAIKRDDLIRRDNLAYVPIRSGDKLLLQGGENILDDLEGNQEFSATRIATEQDLTDNYRLQERIFIVRVPRDSKLGGSTLAKSRIGDAFDFRLLGTIREDALKFMPEPDEVILGGDLLLLQGRAEDLDVLVGLQELTVQQKSSLSSNIYESDRLATLETTLAPQSKLAGENTSDVNFREKYGLELIAIWRSGNALHSDLDKQQLLHGDALLFIGPRNKLSLLNDDPDFLVLTPVSVPSADTRRAPLASLIMLGVITAVLIGWLPISVAAILGASLMVLSGCLNMEQAYRAIDWRAVFLIAGMLPLGIAMQETGTAEFLATKVMASLGEFGPWPVIMGLYAITALGTMIIPTAALVVLMSPIVLSACTEMGIMPQTAMMAIAMAASASFTSPISHPANILVMGPGGYRFADYIKLGVPLTLVIFVAVMLLLPIFWPLVPIQP
ncbi:MAG TPA: SLC13 family permease [Gammaproteobacteria bacterium]|nr:SLC13 family permease [Chromatiales bacterium]MCP4926769.1 SLC13 family permease [Gammaproteobacteria bacterium]MDP7153804.1 SLC13 family permease [Gammaproteobacteria bacterium]MDP7295942.1 SLC13 family permease [Gammaproteobacteria bacterium]MDP7660930.1 SLC13 family permease [Gammaproteobacteria bacterium]